MASLRSRKLWMDAVRYSDLKTLKRMIKNNFDLLNTKFEKNRTCLMVAVILGNIDVVKLLLKPKYLFNGVQTKWNFQEDAKKCFIDDIDDNGYTALMLACKVNNWEIIKLLVESKADVDFLDGKGEHPLFFVIRKGNISAVCLLVNAGCQLNILSSHTGQSALTTAIGTGFSEIAQVLIQAGCDVNIKDCDGTTPLISAVRASNTQLVMSLIKAGCDTDAKSTEGNYTALFLAVGNKERTISLKLIEAGCNVNLTFKKEDYTVSSLMLSITNCSDAALAHINAHCDVNAADSNGLTPLMLSCLQKDSSVIGALLKAGAEVNRVTPDGITAVNILVSQKDVYNLKLLLHSSTEKVQLGQDVVESAYKDYLESGDYTLIKELVLVGASVVECMGNGSFCQFTPFACRNIRLCTNLLHMAAERNDEKFMAALLKQQENFNMYSVCVFDGMMMLMIACRYGYARIIKRLVNADVDVNRYATWANNKMAAIHYAAIHGDVQSLQILTEGGAAIDTAVYQGCKGWSIIHFAAKFGHKELLTYIVNQLDLNPNARNGNGQSPLDLSLEFHHRDVTSILIQAGAKTAVWTNRVLMNFGRANKKAKEVKNFCPIQENDAVLNLVLDAKSEKLNGPPSRRHLSDSSSQPSVPSSGLTIDQLYKMKTPIGLALVVNNQIFDEGSGMENRDGSQVDLENVVQSLARLGYQVRIYENLTSQQLIGCFEHYRKSQLNQFSCLICIVMSHGKRGHVYGVEGKSVPILELTSKFKSTKCRSLDGKPKCLIFVSCQSNGAGTLNKNELIPVDEKDFLVAYSTTPGAFSYRMSDHGTPFMQCLVENINKYADIRCMTRIFENTSKHVYANFGQMPLIFSSLRKQLILKTNARGSRDIVTIPRFNKDSIPAGVRVAGQPTEADEECNGTDTKRLVPDGASEGATVTECCEIDTDLVCQSDTVDIANLCDLEGLV